MLLVLTNRYKNLLIVFIIELLILTTKRSRNYNSILVIINWLIKIVYNKLINISTYILSLTQGIFDIEI